MFPFLRIAAIFDESAPPVKLVLRSVIITTFLTTKTTTDRSPGMSEHVVPQVFLSDVVCYQFNLIGMALKKKSPPNYLRLLENRSLRIGLIVLTIAVTTVPYIMKLFSPISYVTNDGIELPRTSSVFPIYKMPQATIDSDALENLRREVLAKNNFIFSDYKLPPQAFGNVRQDCLWRVKGAKDDKDSESSLNFGPMFANPHLLLFPLFDHPSSDQIHDLQIAEVRLKVETKQLTSLYRLDFGDRENSTPYELEFEAFPLNAFDLGFRSMQLVTSKTSNINSSFADRILSTRSLVGCATKEEIESFDVDTGLIIGRNANSLKVTAFPAVATFSLWKSEPEGTSDRVPDLTYVINFELHQDPS